MTGPTPGCMTSSTPPASPAAAAARPRSAGRGKGPATRSSRGGDVPRALQLAPDCLGDLGARRVEVKLLPRLQPGPRELRIALDERQCETVRCHAGRMSARPGQRRCVVSWRCARILPMFSRVSRAYTTPATRENGWEATAVMPLGPRSALLGWRRPNRADVTSTTAQKTFRGTRAPGPIGAEKTLCPPEGRSATPQRRFDIGEGHTPYPPRLPHRRHRRALAHLGRRERCRRARWPALEKGVAEDALVSAAAARCAWRGRRRPCGR
jgi:hypothetical protein